MQEQVSSWQDFTTLEKCIAVLLMASVGAVGAGILWAFTFIAFALDCGA